MNNQTELVFTYHAIGLKKLALIALAIGGVAALLVWIFGVGKRNDRDER